MIRIINENELDQITGGCYEYLRYPGTELNEALEKGVFYQIDPSITLSLYRFHIISVAYS